MQAGRSVRSVSQNCKARRRWDIKASAPDNVDEQAEELPGGEAGRGMGGGRAGRRSHAVRADQVQPLGLCIWI